MCFLGNVRQVIIFTLLDGVVSSRDGQNTGGLHPCSHEEAHTRRPHELRFEDGDDKNSRYIFRFSSCCSFPGFTKHSATVDSIRNW